MPKKKHLGGKYYATRQVDGYIVIKCGGEDNVDGAQHLVTLDHSQQHDCQEEEKVAKRLKMKDINVFDTERYEYISLSPAEMKTLMDLYPKMENHCHELMCLEPCLTTHHNQMAYYECSECCPDQKIFL
jgi:hypothetical protein